MSVKINSANMMCCGYCTLLPMFAPQRDGCGLIDRTKVVKCFNLIKQKLYLIKHKGCDLDLTSESLIAYFLCSVVF